MKRTNRALLVALLLAPVLLQPAPAIGSPNPEDLRETIRKAEDGDPDAQYNLGVCYANGEGVKKSRSEAIKWYRKAAAQGDEEAQNALRKLGVEQDANSW